MEYEAMIPQCLAQFYYVFNSDSNSSDEDIENDFFARLVASRKP